MILARGLGTRMRRLEGGALLTAEQSGVADAGFKAMIPIGRPFLDYGLSALADAGITDVCLVIGPEHQRVRDYYGGEVELSRLRVHFAVQEQALGTANAVLAAEHFAEGEHVLAVNGDNYYPVATLRALRELGAAGVVLFERDALIRHGNITDERIASFSVALVDAGGYLERIIEKPDAEALAAIGSPVLVGMNSWSLPSVIYDACRRIAPSSRGELEIQDAVQFARDRLGVAFRVLVFQDGVLDLTTRDDIATVAERLGNVTPLL